MDSREALAAFDLPLTELLARADRARREAGFDRVETCTILNARSGRCPEDCRYCAQSVRYQTGVDVYPMLGVGEILDAARRAAGHGADRFSLVTSGKALTDREVDRAVGAIEAVRAEVGITVCASLGHLRRDQLERLRDAGLSRYHHNLETSRRYYPRIVSTHTYDQRIATVLDAAAAGLEVCSGGIIGMGEEREDRVDLALELSALPVCSVPINILLPVPGTPLEGTPPLGALEVLRTIAVFRLLLPDRTIRLAGGREAHLPDFQGAVFLAGANAMMVGGYLTRAGRPVEDDRALIAEIERSWRG